MRSCHPPLFLFLFLLSVFFSPLVLISSTSAQMAKYERMRTWSDATGKFKTEAKLVSVTDDEIVLESETGKTLKLPVSKLGSTDQEFIREFKTARFDTLKKQASECVYAKDALKMYQDFLAAGHVESEQKLLVEEMIAELQSQTATNSIILPRGYLPESELVARKLEAKKLVDEWISETTASGKVDNRKKINDAIELDPTSLEAAIIVAMFLEIREANHEQAQRRLEEAVKSGQRYSSVANPADQYNLLVAMNNLAVSNIRVKKVSRAMRIWSEASELNHAQLLAPASHNVAKVLRMLENNRSGLTANRSDKRAFYEFAAKLGAQGGVGGWHMLQPQDCEGQVRSGLLPIVNSGGAVERHGGVIEDSRCVFCNGVATVRCPNKGCQKGQIKENIMGPLYTTFPDGSRKQTGVGVVGVKNVRCGNCGGKGRVDCPCCDKGRQDN